jgi:hypothetical protein
LSVNHRAQKKHDRKKPGIDSHLGGAIATFTLRQVYLCEASLLFTNAERLFFVEGVIQTKIRGSLTTLQI